MTQIDPKVWAENQPLFEEILRDYHWMARRYADGRQSYAVGLFNGHTENLLDAGLTLNPTADEKLFADDAMFGPYRPRPRAELKPLKQFDSNEVVQAALDVYSEWKIGNGERPDLRHLYRVCEHYGDVKYECE